jgi:hypothetical protein
VIVHLLSKCEALHSNPCTAKKKKKKKKRLQLYLPREIGEVFLKVGEKDFTR